MKGKEKDAERMSEYRTKRRYGKRLRGKKWLTEEKDIQIPNLYQVR